MVKPALHPHAQSAAEPSEYELPLNERMRTFLRLDFLYQQMLHTFDDDASWGTRSTIDTLLDILSILARGDIRSEVHKEIDIQINRLQRYSARPDVDSGRLDSVLKNLLDARADISAIGTQFLQDIKDSDFLNAIKHRSTIPGGTCEFDLPIYSHWLKQPFEQRQDDMQLWTDSIRPVCDAVSEVLWLIRESAQPEKKKAINGMFQHSMQKDSSCRLLRVTLPSGSGLYPEISGSQHRFTIRFLEWSGIQKRAVQTGHDVSFHLSIC